MIYSDKIYAIFLFEEHFVEIFIHVPVISIESSVELFKLLPLPVLVTTEQDTEPILYDIDPKNTVPRTSRDELVYYDIDKSQLSDGNKIQDKLFCEHSLVGQKGDYPNSCLITVYAGDTMNIGNNCDFTVSQRNEFVYSISPFAVLCYTLTKGSW